jgi:uncharacterized membrane protein
MEISKKIQKEDIIKYYKRAYEKKKELTEKEKEQLLQWIMFDKFQDEIKGIKPLIMGGFPRLIYDAVTPYYQIIASIFLIIGILLAILSICGLYLTSNRGLIGYMFPSLISILFGTILILFLNKVKV